MNVGDLVKIKNYSADDIFIILRQSKNYAVPVYIVWASKTGSRFKMAGKALLPVGEVL